MRNAQNGDSVRVHFSCYVGNGTQVANTDREEPLALTLGEGKLIDCFEESIIGMAEGEQKSVHLQPEQAMGEMRPELISQVPLHSIPELDEDLKVGSRITVKDVNGKDIRVTVTHLSDHTVTIDANHLLAGKSLIFYIELLKILH